MLSIAFKEWAVICEALATGRQAIILRKGGIAELGGRFTPEYPRFWLFPTYLHQQESGLRADAASLLREVQSRRPSEGRVVIQHFAEVGAVYSVRDLAPALQIASYHVWSEEVVRQRFAYKTPGLFALAVRIHALPQPIEVEDLPRYAGCKSWVELETPISTAGASPVLEAGAFDELLRQLDGFLSPTALA